MRKIYILVVFTLLFASCENKKKDTAVNLNDSRKLSPKEWTKKKNVNSKSKAILEKWPEFNAFDTSFDALYSVSNIEDLTLVIETLIEKQKLLEKSKYPKEFNLPEIKGRQKVVKTFMLKVKGDIEYSEDTKSSIKDMIKAYNALRNQFNVILNNTFDKSLILEE